MDAFVMQGCKWTEQMLKVPKAQLAKSMMMGDKVFGLLKFAGRKKAK